MMKVLLLGADEQLTSDLVLCLKIRYSDLETTLTDDGSVAIIAVEKTAPDIVVINNIFQNSHLETIIKEIRVFSEVPIFVLSDSLPAPEKARSLEAGADDFITKPIDCLECLSVINSVLRRTFDLPMKQENLIRLDERIVLNTNTHDLTISENHIHLTPFEYKLLSILARNKGLVLSYKTLLEKVWGSNYSTDVTLLKKYIYYLRKKIEVNPRDPQVISNERGYGYKLLNKVLSSIILVLGSNQTIEGISYVMDLA
ncbi:MAG: response regulator transcription factor [Dehalogenimonas sp.]